MNIINRNKKRNKTGNPIQVRAQKTRDKSSDQISKSYRSDSSLHIQRKCADCEKEEQVQRKESGQTGSKMSVSHSVQNSIKSSQGMGSPMAPNTSKFLGEKTGYDFSRVNIHNDERSHGLAHELNAKAFTVGDDIYFGKGEYSPETHEGKKLIAHEAAHVMQQNKNAVNRKKGKACSSATVWNYSFLNNITTREFSAMKGCRTKVRFSAIWQPIPNSDNKIGCTGKETFIAEDIFTGKKHELKATPRLPQDNTRRKSTVTSINLKPGRHQFKVNVDNRNCGVKMSLKIEIIGK